MEENSVSAQSRNLTESLVLNVNITAA